MSERIKNVTFISQNLKDSYESLQEGTFEDKELYKSITRVKEQWLNNPLSGIHIQSKLIPKEYKQNYGVTNLWKCDLPNAWRLVYTIVGDEVRIVSVILEWMSHKEYERRFNY